MTSLPLPKQKVIVNKGYLDWITNLPKEKIYDVFLLSYHGKDALLNIHSQDGSIKTQITLVNIIGENNTDNQENEQNRFFKEITKMGFSYNALVNYFFSSNSLLKDAKTLSETDGKDLIFASHNYLNEILKKMEKERTLGNIGHKKRYHEISELLEHLSNIYD